MKKQIIQVPYVVREALSSVAMLTKKLFGDLSLFSIMTIEIEDVSDLEKVVYLHYEGGWSWWLVMVRDDDEFGTQWTIKLATVKWRESSTHREFPLRLTPWGGCRDKYGNIGYYDCSGRKSEIRLNADYCRYLRYGKF